MTTVTLPITTRARVSLRAAASSYCTPTPSGWFPVAPGTTLPEAPAPTTNPTPAPPNAVTAPEDWNPDAPDLCYLFQDILPVSTPPVFPETLNAPAVAPYIETVRLDAAVRLGVGINTYPYDLTPVTVSLPLRTRPRIDVAPAVLVNAGIPASITVATHAPTISGGASVAPPAASITVATHAPLLLYHPYEIPVPAAAITVATAAPSAIGAHDPNYSSVAALLLFNGTNNSTTITDSGPLALSCTASGDAKISTAQSYFGGASLQLDGTGDYVTIANNSALNPTGDFTVEFFWRPGNVSAGQVLVNKRGSGNGTGFQITQPGNDPSKVRIAAGDNNATAFEATFAGTTTLTINQWYFIQATRSGSTFTLYVDGVSQGTATWAGAIDWGTGLFTIGAQAEAYSAPATGFMDAFRFTPGVVRPSAVPTAEFPAR